MVLGEDDKVEVIRQAAAFRIAVAVGDQAQAIASMERVQRGQHVVVGPGVREAMLQVDGVQTGGKFVIDHTDVPERPPEGGQPHRLQVGHAPSAFLCDLVTYGDHGVDGEGRAAAGRRHLDFQQGMAQRVAHDLLEIPQGAVAIEGDRQNPWGSHRSCLPPAAIGADRAMLPATGARSCRVVVRIAKTRTSATIIRGVCGHRAERRARMGTASRVIFWDFDGTLATRAGMWSGALVEALMLHDPACPVTRAQLAPFLRAGFPWHTPDLPHLDRCTPDTWWAHLQGVLCAAYEAVGLSAATAAVLAQRARECYLDPAGWTVYADTLPVLTGLAARGWRHVIVSNHVPELPALVEALGLGTVVDRVVTSALVGYEKPHREIFRIALELAGRPDIAWMVGDNVVADVLGAERAGIRAILVRQTDGRVRRFSADLHGVPALLAGPSRPPGPTPPA